MPTTLRPIPLAPYTTDLITELSPGTSPPPVRMPIFFASAMVHARPDEVLERSYGSNRSNEREIEGLKLPYRLLLYFASLFLAGGLLVVVFAPGEPDDQNVERGQQQEGHGVGVEEPVNLKEGEKAEH